MTNEIQHVPENLATRKNQIIKSLSDKAAGVFEEIAELQQKLENCEHQYDMLELKMKIAEMTRDGAEIYLNYFLEHELITNDLDYIRAIEAMMRTYALTRSIEKSDEAGRKIIQDIESAKYFVAILSYLGPNYCWDWGAQQEYYFVQDDYDYLSSNFDIVCEEAMSELYTCFCIVFDKNLKDKTKSRIAELTPRIYYKKRI